MTLEINAVDLFLDVQNVQVVFKGNFHMMRWYCRELQLGVKLD